MTVEGYLPLYLFIKMLILDPNWLTEEPFNVKKKLKILKRYIGQVTKKFELYEIYPFLSHLIEHYQSLTTIKTNKEKLEKLELKSIDIENLKMIYEPIGEDIYPQFNKLVAQSIPLLGIGIKYGQQKYDEIDKEIDFFHLGLVTSLCDEGYIITFNPYPSVFTYKMESIILNKIGYKKVTTRLIDEEIDINITSPKEIQEKYILPLCEEVPPTFTGYIDREVSIDNTLLPILKRKIIIFTRDL